MSMLTALFHRTYRGYTGGHGKIKDYFNHVERSGLYRPRIYFTPDSVFDKHSPWGNLQDVRISSWQPEKSDLLFLAGMDWEAIPDSLPSTIPIINLIQGLRHTDPGLPLYGFLRNHAIRICVSRPIAEAVIASGQVDGPVVVIPNGIEVPEPFDSGNRSQIVFIDAIKNTPVGVHLGRELRTYGYEVDLLTSMSPRAEYLLKLGRARIAILLPLPVEGFYLPGLEAMACGTPVIMPDCVGNREYARNGENCLIVEPGNMSSAVRRLDSASELDRLRAAGIETSKSYTLAREYNSFLEVLNQVEKLWQIRGTFLV